MSELEDLIRQRKELDAKIKALKEKDFRYDRAKLFLYHFASRPDEWRVAVLCQEHWEGVIERWKTIISSTSKESALASIDTVISSLDGLRKQLTEVTA